MTAKEAREKTIVNNDSFDFIMNHIESAINKGHFSISYKTENVSIKMREVFDYLSTDKGYKISQSDGRHFISWRATR